MGGLFPGAKDLRCHPAVERNSPLFKHDKPRAEPRHKKMLCHGGFSWWSVTNLPSHNTCPQLDQAQTMAAAGLSVELEGEPEDRVQGHGLSGDHVWRKLPAGDCIAHDLLEGGMVLQ